MLANFVGDLEKVTNLNLAGDGDRVEVARDDVVDETFEGCHVFRQLPFVQANLIDGRAFRAKTAGGGVVAFAVLHESDVLAVEVKRVHSLKQLDLLPELGYRPVNKYLPPRRGRMAPEPLNLAALAAPEPETGGNGILRWVDRLLSR